MPLENCRGHLCFPFSGSGDTEGEARKWQRRAARAMHRMGGGAREDDAFSVSFLRASSEFVVVVESGDPSRL